MAPYCTAAAAYEFAEDFILVQKTGSETLAGRTGARRVSYDELLHGLRREPGKIEVYAFACSSVPILIVEITTIWRILRFIMKSLPTPAILTIGHSTHPIGEFVEMLKAHAVETVVDIRTVPRSRHNPQFDQAVLPGLLADAGLDYVYIKELGGLRKTTKDSVNGGWRNISFRGYADHMQTPDFLAGLEKLMELASHSHVAIMCAEAVPWRCHRSLVGDALLVRGIAVEDIMSATSRKPHKLTSFAKVHGKEITYPPYDDPAKDG